MASAKEVAILELIAYGFALHAVVARRSGTMGPGIGSPFDSTVEWEARAVAQHFVAVAQAADAGHGALSALTGD